MTLTTREKADRYDSLQLAINLAAERYRGMKESADKEYAAAKQVNMLMAFNKRQSTAFEFILQDLERWENERKKG